MKDDYLIVHKSVVPDFFNQVLEVRQILEEEKISVSSACKRLGLNRSTYYKYKDYIFRPNQNLVRRALIALNLKDEPGVLSSILNYLAKTKANIITINQETPFNKRAYVTITLGIDRLIYSIDEITKHMKGMQGVNSVDFIAVE